MDRLDVGDGMLRIKEKSVIEVVVSTMLYMLVMSYLIRRNALLSGQISSPNTFLG